MDKFPFKSTVTKEDNTQELEVVPENGEKLYAQNIS